MCMFIYYTAMINYINLWVSSKKHIVVCDGLSYLNLTTSLKRKKATNEKESHKIAN